MIEHNGCPLPGYDQELWHKLGDYPSRRPEESLMLFRLLREWPGRTASSARRRHIIRPMVEMVQPKPTEVVCDPA